MKNQTTEKDLYVWTQLRNTDGCWGDRTGYATEAQALDGCKWEAEQGRTCRVVTKTITVHQICNAKAPAPYAKCTTLNRVKKGDYVKRSASVAKVYIKGDYDASAKEFCLTDTEDTNNCIYLSGCTSVYIGFTY